METDIFAKMLFALIDGTKIDATVETSMPAFDRDGNVVSDTLRITCSYGSRFYVQHADGHTDYVYSAAKVYELLCGLNAAGLIAEVTAQDAESAENKESAEDKESAAESAA